MRDNYKVKYKNKNIIIREFELKGYYICYKPGAIIIYINKRYSKKEKSKILHKALREQ